MAREDARLPADIRGLLDQLEAAEREARALVAGLSEEQGTWRLEPGSWSISECFDHLATANRVYLVASQADVHAFLRGHADLDLAGIRFPNPLVRGVRFSLATGLHVIAAHERRHLWQAWKVRRMLGRDEQGGAGGGRG